MRRVRSRLCLAALGSLGACSVPTEVPKFDTEWNVPAKSTSISVNDFLPAGVRPTQDNLAFQVTVSPATSTITRQLGQDCPTCAASNGQTIPKPAFVGGGTANITLPSSVTSATLLRDTLTVTVANGYNFDPIRPGAATHGYLVITVKNGGVTIGRDSIDGNATALPPGSNTARKIPLAGTITGAAGLQIATTLSSPLGGAVTINASQTLSVSGSTGTFVVSGAQVNLVNQAVTAASSDLDLGGVESLGNHVTSGSLLLTITNPFNVTGTLVVTFVGAGAPILKSLGAATASAPSASLDFTKTITLAVGTTTQTITLSQDELKSLFGRKITITFGGTINGSGIAITPGQVVDVASRLQVTLNTGSN